MTIFLDAPNVGEIEKQYLARAIDSGFVSSVGPYIPEFEKELAVFVGCFGAVAVQSGTAALHMALYESGIGEGDEVILPVLTFAATANAVVYVGAKPIFTDVDKDTWNISPDDIEKKITDRTRAIIPVHLYGNPCDMDPIMELARAHNLCVIEDATESLGAAYKGRSTGAIGDFGCFSFNGNKIITTGGGGMITGNDIDKLDHIKFLVNQAKSSAAEGFYSDTGFNYRMTNIEAALGIAQMSQVKDFLAKKRNFSKIYKARLKGNPEVRFQTQVGDSQSSWWLTSILLQGIKDIDVLRKSLHEKGIPTRRIFTPLSGSACFRQFSDAEYPQAQHIYEKGLSLPSSTLNSDADILQVCDTLNHFIP